MPEPPTDVEVASAPRKIPDEVKAVIGLPGLTGPGPHELVHGERESFVGACGWQPSGLRIGSPGLNAGGGET
jgi:hypothetical protein